MKFEAMVTTLPVFPRRVFSCIWSLGIGGRNDIEIVRMWALQPASKLDGGAWTFFSPCTSSQSQFTTSVVCFNLYIVNPRHQLLIDCWLTLFELYR
jgi:hypothetical protein